MDAAFDTLTQNTEHGTCSTLTWDTSLSKKLPQLITNGANKIILSLRDQRREIWIGVFIEGDVKKCHIYNSLGQSHPSSAFAKGKVAKLMNADLGYKPSIEYIKLGSSQKQQIISDCGMFVIMAASAWLNDEDMPLRDTIPQARIQWVQRFAADFRSSKGSHSETLRPEESSKPDSKTSIAQIHTSVGDTDTTHLDDSSTRRSREPGHSRKR